MRYTMVVLMFFLGAACGASTLASAAPSTAQAKPLALPTPEEAAHALLKMMDMMELEQMAEARLGTCVPAIEADHPGQVACTVALKIGAGTSETQADFHHDGKEWIAQPSQSQEQLPFPDPKL